MPTPSYGKRRGHPGALAVVTILAILVLIALVVGNNLFSVKRITVEGNVNISKDEIIALSGIAYESSMFSVDTKRVREGIGSNRYLVFEGLWRDLPDHIILRVSEQSPHASLTWMGLLLLLDSNCIVLEQTNKIDMMLDIPTITGMQIESGRVGFPIVASLAGQAEAVSAVLSALDRKGLARDISELNVASLDNLYLVTSDGMQVMLGNALELSEKLDIARAVLDRLRPVEDVRGGVLDVSTGVNGDYSRPKRLREEQAAQEEAAAQEAADQEAATGG